MDRGLYVITSGMLAELQRQERIANDLANASTPGYKSEAGGQHAFSEMLLGNSLTGGIVGTATIAVVPTESQLDLAQGALRRTEEPLDVALDGKGFLVVAVDGGRAYTRNGQLRLDGEGRLVTATGHPLLTEAGTAITATGSGELVIGPDGSVTRGGKDVGRLAVVTLEDPVKSGDGLYSGTVGKRPEGTAVRQGMLEGSNVSAAEAMVTMIASLRAFEAAQRVLHSIDESLQRAVQVGAVS
jgi:flagellar basal-body rod protein FlgG